MARLRRAPAYANALLEELRIEGSADVYVVAQKLNLDITSVDAANFDGALVRAKNAPVGSIAVRNSIREKGRRNFTIAHEIGHFVLPGHDQAGLICTDADVGAWGDDAKNLEREADEFAAELLMPSTFALSIIRTGPPSLRLVEDLSNACSSSLSSAAWRFCDLTSERCAVIWSTDRTVCWSRRSEDFRFGLKNHVPVPQGSFAFDCFNSHQVPDNPQPVSARLWIDSWNVEEDGRIWEQSRILPFYRSVLTLLWIKDRIEKRTDYDEDELLKEL